ncbi:Lrp/AsnC family transcriptional regulator [Streptomyces iconiensis]|uniref:Lrp/AsnC family transcriptional regulator n=1 Tax=Streptomyces iconiensis TaxID=1384038 RepID=A0ABT6ZR32_9ACTN|nr:Lrp/AsnC family transcriptional regulator [Streptomyces iconiensis]MDJ1131307.1 Lrp/AsnC family transcriptional regulator [Streptomyces iconiensis]
MPKPSPFVPDSLDHQLLRLLQEDAGRTLRELGDHVGLSPSAVQRRIRGYRAAGVIAREVAVLDPTALGAATLAVVLVTLERESSEHHAAFRTRMLAEPHVQQCYDLAGPWDYVVVLVTESLAACRALSDGLFMNDENVRRYETLPVLEPVKTGLTVPLPEP